MSVVPRIRRWMAVILAAGILTLGVGGAAVASSPVAGSSPGAATEDRQGPQFYSGVAVDVSGTIDGDVYVAAQSVTISGDVTGDVIAAGQTITVTGTVDGDVRLAGQDVMISGAVSRSGTVFASDLTVSESGSFGDDIVAAAGRVNIAGQVGRDAVLSVGRLTIDGTVGGDVTYVSDNTARISDGSVGGNVERIEPPQPSAVEVSPWAVVVGWLLGLFYALVALSLITLFAGLLFPRWLHRVTDHLIPSPWKALLVGFVASLAMPVALLFLAVTIIGAPLALAVLLIWIVMILATFVYGAYYLGRLMFRDRGHPVVMSLVGGVVLIVALRIPWLNIVVWLAMVFFGLGAQLLEIHRQRPWHRPPAAVASQGPVAETTPRGYESGAFVAPQHPQQTPPPPPPPPAGTAPGPTGPQHPQPPMPM
jgi:cytoskeletal protein CcmA (bactofilin family)